MEILLKILPIILYILLSILVVVLIILIFKAMNTLKKVDETYASKEKEIMTI